MTYADPALLAARSYLIGRGWQAPYLGIVGDPAHKATGGYHCGNDWLADAGRLNTDYSKRQSSRDRPGSDAAMGFDIGCPDAQLPELRRFSIWLANQVRARTPDTADIREIIYSPDGMKVICVDVLPTGRTTAGVSHRTHTHLSYHRDSEGRDKTALFRRYYEGPAPTSPQGDDELIYLFKFNTSDHVYLGENFMRYRSVMSPEELVQLQAAMAANGKPNGIWTYTDTPTNRTLVGHYVPTPPAV